MLGRIAGVDGEHCAGDVAAAFAQKQSHHLSDVVCFGQPLFLFRRRSGDVGDRTRPLPLNMPLAASSVDVLFVASALVMFKCGVDGAAYAVFITYSYWIGFSALALRYLKRPSVDVVWFALDVLPPSLRGRQSRA